MFECFGDFAYATHAVTPHLMWGPPWIPGQAGNDEGIKWKGIYG